VLQDLGAHVQAMRSDRHRAAGLNRPRSDQKDVPLAGTKKGCGLKTALTLVCVFLSASLSRRASARRRATAALFKKKDVGEQLNRPPSYDI
jgi:hypothetical protein